MLCLTAPVASFASGPGTSAANFLKIPVGARETSLGGAFSSVADNADAVFYNPAGLGLLSVPEVSYAYNSYLTGVSQQWLAASYPAKRGAFALGFNYLNVKPFDSYDNSDNRTGSVSAYDMAAYLGYGGRLGSGLAGLPSLRYGAAVKFISETLDTSKASGYGLDAGLLILPNIKNLAFGLGVENLASSRIEFIDTGARLPLKFKTGVSYLAGRPGGAATALLSLDLDFPQDGKNYFSAGLENTLYGALSLRAGYSSFGDVSSGVSFGLGFSLPRRGGRDMRLDYSYGASYDLGNIHKFGFSCRFGEAEKAPPAGKPAAAKPAPPSVQKTTAAANGPDTVFERQLNLLYGDNPAESRAAAEYLAGTDNPIVTEHFIALLSSGKTGWKLAAVHGLGLRKDSRSLKALEGGLTDEDQEVRRQTAVELGRRGEAGSAAGLMAALKNEESDSVKSAIIEALGKLPAPGRQ